MPTRRIPVLTLLLISALTAGFSLGAVTSCHSRALVKPSNGAARVRNVILLIGDGMGPQQIALADLYARRAPNSPLPGRRLRLRDLMDDGETGMSGTDPGAGLVNDSAGSATQLATARLSRPGMIGVDADGDPAETILEKARAAGLATGLVSTVRITDATPAAFAAHQPYRYLEPEIAVDLLASRTDVMLSGGLRSFLPRSINDPDSQTRAAWRRRLPEWFRLESKRSDERDLTSEARELGYQVVFDRDSLSRTNGAQVLGLFASGALPDAIAMDRTRADPRRTVPSLTEMTAKAIEVLEHAPNGFFLMVEGGQIDWAGHDNDAGTLLHEMLGFDEAVGLVWDWARRRDDTLVVVTADHETGSFGFSYSRWNLPSPVALPGRSLHGEPFLAEFNFGDPAVLDRLFAQRSSFGEILERFDSLDEGERTPASLVKLVNESSSFPITIEDAERVLATEPNESYVPGHRYLNDRSFPRVHDLKEFYVDPPRARAALLGRAMAREQDLVWGTGTHTSTLVLVIAAGPEPWRRRFDGFHHETEVGRILMDSLGLR